MKAQIEAWDMDAAALDASLAADTKAIVDKLKQAANQIKDVEVLQAFQHPSYSSSLKKMAMDTTRYKDLAHGQSCSDRQLPTCGC